jgi:mycothiol synthase
MDIIYRAFDPNTDQPGVVELHNQIYPEQPITLEERLEFENLVPPETIRERWVAVHDETMLGFAMTIWYPGDPPGQFFIVCWVHLNHRGQGIGKRLTREAIAFALSHDALKLLAWVREDNAVAMRFAEAHGFVLETVASVSALDLESFDLTAFDDPTLRLEAAGVRFTDLEQWGNTLEHRQVFHQSFLEFMRDAPNIEYQPSFEDFSRETLGRNTFSAPGLRLVLDPQDRVIGWTGLDFDTSTKKTYCYGTWVQADRRGRGLAFALKLAACYWALAQGAKRIVTDNDSDNAPMLAINTKLGFKPEIGLCRLQRVIDADLRGAQV